MNVNKLTDEIYNELVERGIVLGDEGRTAIKQTLVRQVKLSNLAFVSGSCEHPREAREYIGMGELRCTVCGKEFS